MLLAILATVRSAPARPGLVAGTVLVLAALLAGLAVVLEALARFGRGSLAVVVARGSLAVCAGYVLLRLGAAALWPMAWRELDTWHLWPLFTVLGLTMLAVPLLALTTSVALWTRAARPPRDGPAIGPGDDTASIEKKVTAVVTVDDSMR